MAKEICISSTPHETRLAILEDEQLAEIYYERENEYTLAGSIYKGRVTRVLPGMQSSFVDVGLERDAFLYVTDFLEEQEDSEDYVTDSSGGRREPRPRPAEEEQARTADRAPATELDRSSDRHQDARPDRGSDRNPDRTQDRNPDRTRRPALESARDQSREQARAGRERAREQAVAPLREAVPEVQDLEEKGDDQSPEGTRRWRGRRGRRRGVRNGLAAPAPERAADPAPEPLLSDSPYALEEASTAEASAAAPFILAEHGAPGGIASLHNSPSDRAPEPRESRGRDRDRQRTPRESYAPASAPASPVDRAPAILLPGESLSKYGSGPAAASAPAPTASVPRPAARPVNFTPPKPSTLVEVTGGWDGGAVLPGEALSRYRTAPAQPPTHPSAQPEPEPFSTGFAPEPATHSAELPEAGLDQLDADSSPSNDSAPPALPAEPVAQAEHAAQAEPAAQAESATRAEPGAEADPAPTPLAEPELMTQALSPPEEAEPAHVPSPELAAHTTPEPTPEEPAPALEAGPSPAPTPAEYEPENASASYRVARHGASELRLALPEAEEEQQPAPPAASPQAAEDRPAPSLFAQAKAAFEASFFSSPDPEPEPPHDPAPPSTHVPEFEGALAASADQAFQPAPELPPTHALSILHEDGSVESAPPAHTSPPDHGPAERVAETAAATTNEALYLHQPAHEAAPPSHQPSDFAAMVDQLQGFAPGSGLLEEELIEEDEYDFEPIHAHSEDLDQEDLEEETLDQQIDASTLSDAVRDSHLEQRIQDPVRRDPTHEDPSPREASREPRRQQAAPEIADDPDIEEEAFGYEEVGEEEEEAEPAQTREPQRSGRPDEGRGRGRSAGGRGGRRPGAPGRGRSAQSQDLPIISDMLKQGQEILVQIAKEPIAKKGARITSHIALPGRFLVFMPTVSHVGVSRKILSDEERQRLKRILVSEKGDASGGFIVRTAAEGASEDDLRADLRFLISLWTEIKQRSDSAKAPALIYHDLNLIERILRDQVSSNFATIWVDSEAEYERIIRFLSRFQPQLVRRVKLYTKETPLFEHFGIQEEISKALKSKVWLKSGGSIVINQTEALVAIDINTGKYVGKTARLEDTIVKTNLDAIPEIVRQIRLRDLGGIIVIDFIDMDERKNRNRVLAALEEELKHDRAPSKVLQFNDFGLVAITRKRVKQSLERTLSVQCETCTGTGMVKSPITVCNEIYTEMRKMVKHFDGKDVMLRVHPEVVKQLKNNNGRWINELEELVAKTIIIKSDAALHPEQFDIH